MVGASEKEEAGGGQLGVGKAASMAKRFVLGDSGGGLTVLGLELQGPRRLVSALRPTEQA